MEYENDLDRLSDDVWDAVEAKDEAMLKKLIISSMELFLEDKISKDFLDEIASTYLSVPLELKWKGDFQFNDQKLSYVFEELSAIEVVPDKRAKEIVKRMILYLQGKDYENMEQHTK